MARVVPRQGGQPGKSPGDEKVSTGGRTFSGAMLG